MATPRSNMLQPDLKHPSGCAAVLALLLGLLLFNGVGFLILGLRRYHFFRAILILYLTDVVVFPGLLLAVVLFRRVWARSWRLDKRDMLMLAGAAALLSVFVYASVIEPTRLQVEKIEIVSAKVSVPFTVLHISDIQSGIVGSYEDCVFRQILALKPDLIIHTGDLLQSYFFMNFQEEEAKLARLFQSLTPPFGMYNVIGDVDWRLTFDTFDRLAGIRTLQNERQTISIRGTTVHLMGLSLASSRNGNREFVKHWLEYSGSDAFRILFGHAPDYVLDILDLDIDLCLAGHTHGGQIRLPGIGPLITLSRVPKAWARGFRELEHLRLNVSAGIGAEHASQLTPIRINCPPTMTLLTIRPPA